MGTPYRQCSFAEAWRSSRVRGGGVLRRARRKMVDCERKASLLLGSVKRVERWCMVWEGNVWEARLMKWSIVEVTVVMCFTCFGSEI